MEQKLHTEEDDVLHKERLTPDTNYLPILANYPIPVKTNPEELNKFRTAIKNAVVTNIASGYYASVSLNLDSENCKRSFRVLAGYRYLSPSDATSGLPPVSSVAVDKNTLYRISTLTKGFTAVSALQAVENGELCLDDELASFFPEFKTLQVVQVVTPVQTIASTEITAGLNNNQIVVQLTGVANTTPEEQAVVVQLLTSLLGAQVGLQFESTNGGTSTLPDAGVYRVVSTGNVPPAAPTITLSIPAGNTNTFPLTGNFVVAVLTSVPVAQQPIISVVTVPLSVPTLLSPTPVYYTLVPAYNPITIRQLLAGTSGLTYTDPVLPAATFGNNAAVAAAAGIARQSQPSLRMVTQSPNETLDLVSYAKLFATVPLVFEPGTGYAFSPGEAIVAAVLIHLEHKKGKETTLFELQRKGIFEPLGMKSPFYFIQDSDPRREYRIKNLVHLYSYAETLIVGTPTVTTPNDLFSELIDGVYGTNFSAADGSNPQIDGAGNTDQPIFGSSAPRKLELGDAGLSMTTHDYAKFATAITNLGVGKNGVRILSEESVQEMLANQIGAFANNLSDTAVTPLVPAQKVGFGGTVADGSAKLQPLSCASIKSSAIIVGKWFSNVSPSSNLTALTNATYDFGTLLALENTIAAAVAPCEKCDD